MHDHPGAGHHYVDISAPADMLVLSQNEYPLKGERARSGPKQRPHYFDKSSGQPLSS
jgi:hypothetical protein